MSVPHGYDGAVLKEIIRAWSSIERRDSIYEFSSILSRLQIERSRAVDDFTRLTCDENDDPKLAAMISSLKDLQAAMETEEDYRKHLSQYRMTNDEWHEHLRGHSSLTTLRRKYDSRCEYLQRVRERRINLAKGAKACAERKGHEIRTTFEKYLDSTTILNKGRLVSLLLRNRLYFASAVADYDGDWPPTLANLKAESGKLQAEAMILTEELKEAEMEMYGSGRRVSTEMSTELSQSIDLSLSPQERFPHLNDIDPRMRSFNTIQLIQSKITRNKWTIKRCEEWIRMSETSPYSTLEARPVLTNRRTGQKDDTRLRQLMRFSKDDDTPRVSSALQSSPLYSFKWNRDPKLPRAIEEPDSDEDDFKIPLGRNDLEHQMQMTTIQAPDPADLLRAFLQENASHDVMTAREDHAFFSELNRRIKPAREFSDEEESESDEEEYWFELSVLEIG